MLKCVIRDLGFGEKLRNREQKKQKQKKGRKVPRVIKKYVFKGKI